MVLMNKVSSTVAVTRLVKISMCCFFIMCPTELIDFLHILDDRYSEKMTKDGTAMAKKAEDWMFIQ